MLVDYGNLIQVSRRNIWAPVNGLKLFTLPPFGVRCRVENVPRITLQQWQSVLTDKPVKVIFDSLSSEKGCFPVHLSDCSVNATISAILKRYGKTSISSDDSMRSNQSALFQFSAGK